MNTSISREQIDEYQRDGCLLIEDFLSKDEVAELSDAIAEVVSGMGKNKLVGGEIREEGDTYYDKVFLQRINLWKSSETVKRYVLDPELGKMLCDLEGIEGIRVWHDQTLQKQPWANPTGWHLDNPYWSFHSRHAVSIWIALDDATLQNGCMYYLPGTHKLASYDNVGIGENISDLFSVYPDFQKIEPKVGAMKAGSAGVHNGLTAHGANANMTPRWRRAMTCAYMPDGATFNGQKNILSDAQVSALRVGGLLNDERQNPLIWLASMED